MPAIRIHPEVESALRENRPVVALETAVVTHGLPRDPLPETSRLDLPQWDRSQPVNLELARAMERSLHHAGVTPAAIAIIDGTLCIGLDDDELVMLAENQCAEKASTANMAAIIARGGSAGTTVSATLAACACASKHLSAEKTSSQSLSPQSIRVFATGGIGGVHRNWQSHPDISADLRAIATTPVCIVCAGAKSILDLPATLEALETLGVPVVGYRTNCFPQFQCIGTDDLALCDRADDPQTAAQICDTHWRSLQQSTGIILANPVPREFAMNADELEQAVREAEALAAARHIAGQERTPFVLAQIACLTQGRSLDANIALLLNNAQVAAEVAAALARNAEH